MKYWYINERWKHTSFILAAKEAEPRRVYTIKNVIYQTWRHCGFAKLLNSYSCCAWFSDFWSYKLWNIKNDAKLQKLTPMTDYYYFS